MSLLTDDEETQAWQKRIQSRWNNIVQETGIKLEK